MLHTGQGLWWLGLILGLLALSVPVMSVTGVLIWASRGRRRPQVESSASAQLADTVILVGSEGGSSWGFARTLHDALTANGHKVHTAPMNALGKRYRSARQMLILTATYGDGGAPDSGTRFLARLEAIETPLACPVAVLGFGDRWFPDFCRFARDVDNALARKACKRLMLHVLTTGLEIGRTSNGAFDIGLGDLVDAWGFGASTADPRSIRTQLVQGRPPAHQLLEVEHTRSRARKHGAIQLDLSGIAKGYAVDRMMAVIESWGITSALAGLDGELRAKGVQSDGTPWAVAIEKPDYALRTPIAMLELLDASVATSGDYRRWVEVGRMRLSHTMDARIGGPLNNQVASVTVLADTCMEADAWATAMVVMGETAGARVAEARGLSALYILRADTSLVRRACGAVFAADGSSGLAARS